MKVSFKGLWELAEAALIGMAIGGVVAIGLAGLTLVGRAIYWLYSDLWISNACDLAWTAALSSSLKMYDDAQSALVYVGCYNFDTGWKGLNRLLRWFYDLDISLLLFVIGACTLLASYVFALFVANRRTYSLTDR